MDTKYHKLFAELCELRGAIPKEMNASVLLWLKNSAFARTFHVFRDGVGRPLGYVAWADINRESALRMAQTKALPRYPYEWKEGRITLILDFLILNRGLLPVRQALKEFLRKRRAVAFIRRGAPRFYLRRGTLFEQMREKSTATSTAQEPDAASNAPGRSSMGYPLGGCATDIDLDLDLVSKGFRRYPTRQEPPGSHYRSPSPRRASLHEDGIVGRPIKLVGQVVDTRGSPIEGAVLDFWQADGSETYAVNGTHLRGHQYTDRLGRYQLDTVLPRHSEQERDPTTSRRPAHIHVAVQGPGTALLTTHIYFLTPEEESNQDMVFDPTLAAKANGENDLFRFDLVLVKLKSAASGSLSPSDNRA